MQRFIAVLAVLAAVVIAQKGLIARYLIYQRLDGLALLSKLPQLSVGAEKPAPAIHEMSRCRASSSACT